MLNNYLTNWYNIECERCSLDIDNRKIYFFTINKALGIEEVVCVKGFDAHSIGEREFPINEQFDGVGTVNKKVIVQSKEVWVPQSFNQFGLIQKEFNAESICFLEMDSGNWVVRLNRN